MQSQGVKILAIFGCITGSRQIDCFESNGKLAGAAVALIRVTLFFHQPPATKTDHRKKRTMFQQWINNLKTESVAESKPDQHWLERLTALLLLEIARADTTVDEVELKAIERAITASCPSITKDELTEIIATAREDIETTISLHEQVRQINSGFSQEQKFSLIEQMWRVAYADGDLDKYEEYTIRKLSDLIYMDHKDFIQAKLRVTGGQS